MRKNYTQEQKMHAIKQLPKDPVEALDGRTLKVNGEPLKAHRLRRPVMQKGNRVMLAPRPRLTCRRGPSIRSLDVGWTPILQGVQLRQTREVQNFESLIIYTQNYYSRYQSQSQVRPVYGSIEQLGIFMNAHFACDYLESDSALVFSLLKKMLFRV